VSQTLLTPTVISNELLRRFKNNLSFAAGASHEYDDKFQKIGDSYTLRDPVKLLAVDGATMSVQDIEESGRLLQINTQKHSAFQFSSKDLTLTIDRFGERYLDSAAVALANAFEVDGLTMAYQKTYNLVGAQGTTPNTLRLWKQGAAKLDKQACPFDGKRSVVMNSDAEVEIIDVLKGLFQSGDQIKKQYETGRMGRTMGADWSLAQNIRTHTAGPQGGTPLVDGATQSGSSINVKGFTAAVASRLKKGDVIEFGTVYMVNPVSGDQYLDKAQFTLTADFSSDVAGKGPLQLSPALVLTGAKKNVSGAPIDGDTITVKTGAANTLSAQNLIYHKDAFCYAMAPLELPQGVHFAGRSIDKQTGLSIRIVSAYNISTDVFATRADIAYGWAAKREAWACRVIG
jgi:hypothetical protein